MKLKIFPALICVIIFFVSVFSQTSSNCIKQKCTATNTVDEYGNTGCKISFDYKDCDGRSHNARPQCTNGVQGQSNCSCTCTPSPNNGWAMSFDLPTGLNVSDSISCFGCARPTPTPCAIPTSPPPNGRSDCLWLKSSCEWFCGQIADISQTDCEDGGWIWNFTSNSCGQLGGGLGEICSDPPPSFQCGTILPETSCPYTIYGFGSCYSPVLIDVAGDGFRLTNAESGVPFDLDGNPDGMTEQVSWTTPGSDDAWLVLDRNGNGVVDSGRELFGNLTIQPATAAGNGFLALAQYDAVKNGGNADGVIDNHDGFFPLLRLWQDRNHNGLSEAEELQTLSALGVTMLHVDYKESKRVDEYGNEFRYRAKVGVAKSAQGGRWAWDVFLVKEQ